MATPSLQRSKRLLADPALMSSAVRGVVRLSRNVDKVVTEFQLSVSQFRILDRLADGSTGGRSLADWLAVKPPSITALVDGLVKRGLVVRGDDTNDRRLVTHSLTAEGRDVHKAISDKLAERLREILEDAGEGVAMIESLVAWNHCLDVVRDTKRAAGTDK